MLTRAVRWRVLAFVVIALSIVAYIGARYAGVDRLFGAGGYTVTLELSDGGGLFTNGEVTYRGVAVGRVGDLRLTDTGMAADLIIDNSAPPIPENLTAVVANRSAIGEQYVDLQPHSNSGPYLTGNSTIPRESTRLPLPVSTVLGNVSALSGSVPTDSLRTVVDELYNAAQNAGPELQTLVDSLISLTQTAAGHLPATTELIESAATVLRTQVDTGQELRAFSADAKQFAAQLASSDGDLRRLIAAAPGAATQVSGLLADTDPGLSVLLANLLTTADIVTVRTGGLEQLLVIAPRAVAATSTAITPDGGHLSLALTFFDPPPCTAGYQGTPRQQGESVTTNPLNPFNTLAACTVPAGDPRLVRGSQNAPRAGVPPVAVPATAGVRGNPVALTMPALPAVSTSLEDMLWLTK
jgi:phospholipid/cholesterol/gamma-HCH transport system substrate-binding protein